MNTKGMLVWALVLIAVGLAGLSATLLTQRPSSPAGGFASSGEAIYYTGADADGRPIPRVVAGGGVMGPGMMGAGACVDCHGEDGRGGRVGMMFTAIDIPDIRYSSLTSDREQDGITEPAWTDGDIKRAIRDGVEPSGQPLRAPMPRWSMTDTQLSDVLEYLKVLDQR